MIFQPLLYIYNEGQVSGHNFVQKTEWNLGNNGTTSKILVTDNVEYLNKTALEVSLYDSNSSIVAGVSIVDTVGILGSTLKNYTTINVEIGINANITMPGNTMFIYNKLSDVVSGTEYTNNVHAKSTLFSYTAAEKNYRIYSWDISNLDFDDNTIYYFGYRLQTTKEGYNTAYHYFYFSRVWLAPEIETKGESTMTLTRQRRALLSTIGRLPLYLYKEGEPVRQNIIHKSNWDNKRTGAAVNFTPDVLYSGKNTMHAQLTDQSTSTNAGISIVDSIGLLGSEIKKYKTLNIEKAQVMPMASFQIGYFYTNLNGSLYTQNIGKSYDFPNAENNPEFHTISWDISSLSLNNNTRYYFGLRLQTANATTNSNPLDFYFSNIWLEPK